MKYLLILFALIIPFRALLALEGELVPSGNRSLELEEGALFEGVLRIWPVNEDWDQTQLEKLLENKIGLNFYLVKIISNERSIHNSEVAELRGIMALVKAITPNKKIKIEVNDETINIDIRKINSVATAPSANEFDFVEQSQSNKEKQFPRRIIYMLSLGLGLGLIGWAVVIMKKKMKLKKERDLWIHKIKKAEKRQEIENLGQEIDIIDNYLKLSHKEAFCTALNKIQFKKEWSDSELREVKIAMKSMIDV